MGPLVPDIIGNELNFIAALLIGIAFGFILEQAGFSTSKKLVGLFYGYDFTVLRVFFTAGVTAMLGVIILGHFGLLDVNLIYINPTFLWSALAGGFIMGLGFVIGGFCPGTSFCAAAIGKIDAMYFIAGSFIGVFIFAEGYPIFESFYKAEFWGSPRLFDTLGISQGLYAFLLTAMAIGAFWITTLIENRVNGKPNPEFKPIRLYVGLTGIAFIMGFSAFFLPDIKDEYLQESENRNFINSFPLKGMTADELAFRLIKDDKDLQLIDLRSPEEFKKFSLPKSFSFSINSLFEKETKKILAVEKKENIFIADDEFSEKRAAVIAEKIGLPNIAFLKGSLVEFKKEILEFKMPDKINSRQEADTYRFREKASKMIPVLIQQNQTKIIPKKESKRIVGGC
ncbi:MAG TPA: YeeE/YedE thiosulfate transporter family protein [Ignavibacteriaceae bacterium]|nr:YeeE/YedE thiosulfate transporter family protein [Ignavibacteriaceae bacterium]